MAQKDTRQHFVAINCFIREKVFRKDASVLEKIWLEGTHLTSPAGGTDLGGKTAGLWSKRCYSGTILVLTKTYLNI